MKRIFLGFLLLASFCITASALQQNKAVPCTFEISSTDQQRIKNFYQGVFNWKFERLVVPGEVCFRVTADSLSVDRGIPEQPVTIWGSSSSQPFKTLMYMRVSSIDTCLQHVKALGGSVFEDKTAIGSDKFSGYYAICADIDGNYFGLWQNDTVAHADVKAQSFSPIPCAFEVTGKDGAKLKDFYAKVFNWQFVEDKENAGFYVPAQQLMGNTQELPEAPVAVYTEQVNLAEPTGVMVYIKVKSIKDHLARVPNLGGKVLKEKTSFKGFGYSGHYALCEDVDGNNFGIWELEKVDA